jgi:hypothetical protein
MQAVLVMFRSDGERRSFSLARDITVIGRREDCDLRIPLGEISRKHCRLVRDGDSLRLEDLGSSNGTYHNGQRVQEAILSPGDSIQVGPLVFVLQIDGAPPDDELAPVHVQTDEAHEGAPSPEKGPLQPTAQSEIAGDEMPSLDELDSLDSLEDEPVEAGALDGAGAHEGDQISSAELMEEPEELAEPEPLATTQPMGLEAPHEGEFKLDEAETHQADDHGALLEHEGAEGHHQGVGHDDPMSLDDLDIEQDALELEDDEHHEPLKLDEHESPHHP